MKVMAADLANSGKRGGKTGARRGSTRRGTKADLGRVSRRAVEGPGRCVHSVTPRGPRQRGGRGWNALPCSFPFPLSPFPRPVFLPRGRNSGPTVDQSGCVGSSKKVGRVPGASDQSALRRDLRDLSSLCAQDWARTFVPRRREKVTLVVDSLQQPTFVPM